ncbi:22548_t:CDS:2 [Racocetra persica]|uniref:22548_t:CDS:1 n=1 Tax=Racocetra persica TaxID=160502 RepID=A0ACA9MWR7_9GLOM|nr:22548_t:CDS:2 [Racocetra persica]
MAIKNFRERIIESCGISVCLAVVTTVYLCLTRFESKESNLLNYGIYYYFVVKTLYGSIIAHMIPSFSIFYLLLIIGLLLLQYTTGTNYISYVQSSETLNGPDVPWLILGIVIGLLLYPIILIIVMAIQYRLYFKWLENNYKNNPDTLYDYFLHSKSYTIFIIVCSIYRPLSAGEVEMIKKWIKSPFIKMELSTDHENRYLSSIQLSDSPCALTFAEVIYKLAFEEFFIFKESLADDNMKPTTILIISVLLPADDNLTKIPPFANVSVGQYDSSSPLTQQFINELSAIVSNYSFDATQFNATSLDYVFTLLLADISKKLKPINKILTVTAGQYPISGLNSSITNFVNIQAFYLNINAKYASAGINNIKKIFNVWNTRINMSNLVLGINFGGIVELINSDNITRDTINNNLTIINETNIQYPFSDELISDPCRVSAYASWSWKNLTQQPYIYLQQPNSSTRFYYVSYEDFQSLQSKLDFVQQVNALGIAIFDITTLMHFETNHTGPYHSPPQHPHNPPPPHHSPPQHPHNPPPPHNTPHHNPPHNPHAPPYHNPPPHHNPIPPQPNPMPHQPNPIPPQPNPPHPPPPQHPPPPPHNPPPPQHPPPPPPPHNPPPSPPPNSDKNSDNNHSPFAAVMGGVVYTNNNACSDTNRQVYSDISRQILSDTDNHVYSDTNKMD